ncbi:unknown [Succinatimonas sp. CAG:777]|nr:unknown [Succinatimonas sp. CAG:777]
MNKIIHQITSKLNNLPKNSLQALIGAVVVAVIVVIAVFFFMGGHLHLKSSLKKTLKF